MIYKAHEMMREGAKALQTELAFKNTAEALGFDPDKYIAELKRVTNATIDDSDLMQKAMKGISGGIDPGDMLKLAEVSRLAARRMGIDVGEAYNQIVDSVEMMRTKTMVKFHLMTKDQAKLIDAAKELGVEVDATKIIWMNYGVQQDIIGKAQQNEIERMQQHAAAVKQFKEEIGKATLELSGMLIEFIKWQMARESWSDKTKRWMIEIGGKDGQVVTGNIDDRNLAPGSHTEDIGPGQTADERRKAYEDEIKAKIKAA